MRDEPCPAYVALGMRTFSAAAALLGAGLVAGPLPGAAQQPSSRCSHDVFPIGGQAVVVAACGTAQNGTVAVTESLRGASSTLSHSTTMSLLAGASVARTVDDIPLQQLGLGYTLHLTLAYRDGQMTVEHALLLPGARPLK